MHPGRSARVSIDGQRAGFIGELHPRWVQANGLLAAPVLFEINLALAAVVPLHAHNEVSKYPPLSRDIAIALSAVVPAADVLRTLLEVAPERISSIELFDDFRPRATAADGAQKASGGLAETEKSLAFRVVMQDTQKTLTDAEADEICDRLVVAAQNKHQARLRA